jgi:dolichyl-phosphate-mannose-protein mannosyltransferase
LVFAVHFAWLGLTSDFWATNIKMLNYHLSVPPTGDPQALAWWGWPLMGQPFRYWSQTVGEKISTIVSLPNPWIWWTGFTVFLGSLFVGWRQPVTRLLNICLLVTWLPFIFIQRIMYSYHALAFDLFLTILLAVVLNKWWDKYRRWVTVYLIIAAAAFIWFLPWYLNIPLSQTQNRWRQWLPNWNTTRALSLTQPARSLALPARYAALDTYLITL